MVCNFYLPDQQSLFIHNKMKHSGPILTNLDSVPDASLVSILPVAEVSLPLPSLMVPKANSESPQTSPESNGSRSCEVCQKKFRNHKKLVAHIVLKHPDFAAERNIVEEPAQEKDAESTRSPCIFCPKSYSKNYDFVAHVNKMHRDLGLASNWLKCDLCETILPTEKNVKCHMTKVHSRKKVTQNQNQNDSQNQDANEDQDANQNQDARKSLNQDAREENNTTVTETSRNNQDEKCSLRSSGGSTSSPPTDQQQSQAQVGPHRPPQTRKSGPNSCRSLYFRRIF